MGLPTGRLTGVSDGHAGRASQQRFEDAEFAARRGCGRAQLRFACPLARRRFFCTRPAVLSRECSDCWLD
jgi:hypothetical protein